jgi:hypothetical protein
LAPPLLLLLSLPDRQTSGERVNEEQAALVAVCTSINVDRRKKNHS